MNLPSRRVARYADKWCEWAETELEHLVGYVANTTDYCLVFINEGDTWDDLSVEFWADSNFVAPKSTSGEYLELGGPQGSQYPMDWDARLQAVQTTSSGEAEAVSWGSATKGAIKLAAMVEYTRAKPVEIIGHIDSQAVEQAIKEARPLAQTCGGEFAPASRERCKTATLQEPKISPTHSRRHSAE